MSTVDRITSLSQAITLAQKRWPSLIFKTKGHNEASSPCPFCGGVNRFSIFAEGNYVCWDHKSGNCQAKGWILEKEFNHLSDVERRLLIVEAKQAELERKQEQHELQIKALECLVTSQAHIRYHQALNDYAFDYWHSQGINQESVNRWLLGYCQSTPLYQSRASFTMPVINNGKLRNMRHRLDSNKEPRYLPYSKNLPQTLFNADRIIKPSTNHIIIVEGIKKAIVLEQHGLPTVAIFGTKNFNQDWIKWFRFQVIYVCFDYDALEQGAKLAKTFGLKGRVVEIPKDVNKPDDYFVQFSGTVNGFMNFMRKAKVA